MKKQLIALVVVALAGSPVLAQTTVTAEQYFANAQQLAAQADIAYPQPFLDLPLWDSAVGNAHCREVHCAVVTEQETDASSIGAPRQVAGVTIERRGEMT